MPCVLFRLGFCQSLFRRKILGYVRIGYVRFFPKFILLYLFFTLKEKEWACEMTVLCVFAPFQLLNHLTITELGMDIVLLEITPMVYFIISCD
jgi:hypothetical protein